MFLRKFRPLNDRHIWYLKSQLCQIKWFSVSSAKRLKENNFTEVKIPVPWGHISGKWWGSKDIQPILAVHGWLDNAGSWDGIAEHLSEKYSLLAIDLPGCGYSSHLPPFHNYNFSSSPAALRRIQLHYGFKDLVLFAHSGGSATAFLFSCLYPDLVKGYLGVDYLFYLYKREEERAKGTGDVMDKLLSVASRDPGNKKIYKREEAWEAWVAGSILGASNPELVSILMKRGVTSLPDGSVHFNHDQRLKLLKATALDCFSVEQGVNLAENLSCHVCFIQASESPLLKWGIRNKPSLLDIIQKKSKSFQIHTVKGHHHVHLENPKPVMDIAHKFLENIDL